MAGNNWHFLALVGHQAPNFLGEGGGIVGKLGSG
jgi:hypothetical protein